MAKTVELIFEHDGHLRHLVDAQTEQFAKKLGHKVNTWRNSHVESWASLDREARHWIVCHLSFAVTIGDELLDMRTGEFVTNHFWASMLPVGGPVLGPFESRDEALAAEKEYLLQNNLPLVSVTNTTLGSDDATTIKRLKAIHDTLLSRSVDTEDEYSIVLGQCAAMRRAIEVMENTCLTHQTGNVS